MNVHQNIIHTKRHPISSRLVLNWNHIFINRLVHIITTSIMFLLILLTKIVIWLAHSPFGTLESYLSRNHGHFDVGIKLYYSGNSCDTDVPIITLYWNNKMPHKIKTCEDSVKILTTRHQICCTKGKYNLSFYSGCVLSNFLSISGKLDDTREHRVCAGVYNKIRD